jgi:hypothetical protein
MKVAKSGGGYFDHVGKVEQGLNGLNKQITHLQRILKRSGLTESQVTKINGLLNRAKSLVGSGLRAVTKDQTM